MIHDLYVERGNRLTLSFKKSDLDTKDKVIWARVQEGSDSVKKLDPGAVKDALTALDKGHSAGDNICSEFVRTVEPKFKDMDANSIRKTIDVEASKRTLSHPWTNHPSSTKKRRNKTPRQHEALWVSYNAVAEMLDFDASKITRASFDADQEKIILQGLERQARRRCAGEHGRPRRSTQVRLRPRDQPVLSMTFSTEQPGNFEVKFTGPIFDTSFGKNMFEADSLLGLIMFGYLGLERELMKCEFPQWAQRWHFHPACFRLRGLGSRVFMHGERDLPSRRLVR